MSFYRMYRPQTILEIDNAAVRTTITGFLSKKQSDLPHAYFFSGPKGTGKTTSARVIAKLFNCTNLSKSNGPCGQCDQCQTIARGTNLDVLEIDAASNRGIDEMRQLRDRIGFAPVTGTYTVYIIDEVHMLTSEAFNALLKTLEEPPAHAVFILATTDPQKVPATIKSRCLHIQFSKASQTELSQSLTRIVKAEKINIEESALEIIIKNADGSFRDAAKLLEQLSFEKGKITAAVVSQVLAVADFSAVEDILSFLEHGQVKEALKLVESLVQNGTDIKSFMIQLLLELEKQLLLAAKANGNSPRLLWLKRAIGAFTTAYSQLRLTPIPQLPLELAIIEVSNTVDSVSAPADLSASKQSSPISLGEPLNAGPVQGLITLEKLVECWRDVIEELKPYNHSIAGVMRSTRPKNVDGGIVIIETFYKFHLEKLSELKTKDMLTSVLKKLFGEKVKVQIVLGKK